MLGRCISMGKWGRGSSSDGLRDPYWMSSRRAVNRAMPVSESAERLSMVG